MTSHWTFVLGLSLALALGALVDGRAQATLEIRVDRHGCPGAGGTDVVAEVNGGEGAYSFAWSDGVTGPRRPNLGVGTHAVTATAADGGTLTDSITLAGLTLDLRALSEGCAGLPARYAVEPAGGFPPYTVTADGQAIDGEFVAEEERYYHVVVTDAAGCTANAGVKPYASLEVDVLARDVLCAGYCDGTVTALVEGGTGPFRYAWSTGDTTQQVYGLDPGTYTVSVTDGGGCMATASGSLAEPRPITFAVALEDSCAGATAASVEASGGTGALSVRWSTGATGPVAELPEGQHYVYVSDENGCESSDVVIVSEGIDAITTMNTAATCDAGGTAMLCVVGGRGPFTYRWSDGQTGITAVDLTPGTYGYVAVDGGGCRYEGITVVEGPEPGTCDGCAAAAPPLLGGGETAEACDPVALTAAVGVGDVTPDSLAVVYFLTAGSGRVIIASATEAPTFVVEEAGRYTIVALVYDPGAFDPGGEVQFGITTANELYLRTASGGGELCAAISLGGVAFEVPECSEPAGCEGGVPAELSGVVTCANAGGSSAIRAEVATPATVPEGYAEVYVIADSAGALVGLAEAPASEVDDERAYAFRSLVYDPQTTDPAALIADGVATVAELRERLGTCDRLAGDAPTSRAAPFEPDFPAALVPDACVGQMVQLNPIGDSLGYTYLWGPADLLDDPTLASPVAALTGDTTFAVTITRPGSEACSVTRSYAVAVVPGLAVAAGDDVVTCEAQEVTLAASAADAQGVEWASDPDFANVLVRGATLTVLSGEVTTYYARAGDGRCDEVAEVQVTNAPVVASAEGPGEPACEGDEVVITASATGGANSYELLDPSGVTAARDTAGAFAFTPAAAGAYGVVVENAAGCSDTAEVQVELGGTPVTLTADLAADTAIYPGAEVVLTALADADADFEFAEDPSVLTVTAETITVAPTETTTYEVTAIGADGCPTTARATVEVLEFECAPPYVFVPTGFSPDGDGVNEAYFVDAVNVTDAYYAIYNRWGEEVFSSRVLGEAGAWDGTFDGEPVNPDVYGILVNLQCADGEEFASQGNVTVVR